MPKDLLLLPLSQLMPNSVPKSGKTLQPIPLLVSFALESITEIKPCSKKNCEGFMFLHRQRVPPIEVH